MDLHTGTSLWTALNGPGPEYPALEGDCTCDVAIIGSGVSGAVAAWKLVKEGLGCVLLDKGPIAGGSTAASTGLLQYEIDTPLPELIKRVGTEHAVRSYRLGLEAIDEIERLTAEVGDNCGFSRRNNLCLASSRGDLRTLRDECDCLKQHGFDVQFLSRSQLAKETAFRAPAAMISTGDGQIDPLRFTRRLIESATQAGLRVFVQTEVTSIAYPESHAILTTRRGNVMAQKIIFATGYDSYEYLHQKLADLNSTYVVATEPMAPIAGWPEQCLVWETARPYFYMRSTDDGRVLMGGEDTLFAHDHQRDSLIDRQASRLLRRFHKMFPDCAAKQRYAWAGTFAETKDGLAYIGKTPEYPRAYFALGYGGNGITFSVIAARIITDLIVGRPNSDAAIFRFNR